MRMLPALAAPLLLALAGAADAAPPRPAQKVAPGELAFIALAPPPAAKSAAGNPLKPQPRAPQRETVEVQTRVEFDADGVAHIHCDGGADHVHLAPTTDGQR
jgi:hypothetical protein